MRKKTKKPLSFSTTMRNPERIAAFLQCIEPFEEKILTNSLINEIVKKIIKNKLYYTMYQKGKKDLLEIYKSLDKDYTDEQILDIITNSPQNHKEAGFDKGWASRFDTWFKLSKEFGFIYYKINEPIKISQTGHMLCNAYNTTDNPNTGENIQNIFLNALCKYQTNNPFRKNLNKNLPIILLLKTIFLLKNDTDENGAGISRKELAFLLCWDNNDPQSLYKFIKDFRKKYGYKASDENIYAKCLSLLESNNENRFKISQIIKEGIDDLVRKLRMTGIFSLRGMGRFLDLNSFKQDTIEYLIKNYGKYKDFSSELEYFRYMGEIDSNILKIKNRVSITNLDKIRINALKKFAKIYSSKTISKELINLEQNKNSKDEYLKGIDNPTRLEFLISLSLIQKYPQATIKPNYAIDDEGNPTFTARGGIADIELYDTNSDSLIEVTLLQNRSQSINEIPSITRHLDEFKNISKKNLVFSLFIAPKIHQDTIYMCQFTKNQYNLDILPYTISDFTIKLFNTKTINDFFNKEF